MKRTLKRIVVFALVLAISISNMVFDNSNSTYTEAASSSATSKKGIQITGPQLMYQAVELGCESVFVNIRVTDLMSTTNQYLGISLSVGGKTYYLNQSQLLYYKTQFMYARENGIKNIYVQIYAEEFEGLTDTTDSSAAYHAFDTSSTNGKKLVTALFEKLNEYLGEYVDYWMIGNEINDQHTYYEMGTTSLKTYVKNYEKAMRIMYDAAVEYNSDACVMVCLDHEWNSTAGDRFNSMELLTELASVTADDDYNWGVAIHPYPEPLTSANFWDDEDNMATNSEDTDRITMYNLSVFTDFMQKSAMKYNGKVRHIAITECGFNALSDGTEDETLQAAAYAYAYYKAEANKYIDTFIIRSYQDASAEVNQGMCFGLVDLNNDKREIYNVFKFIDTTYGSAFTDKYLDYFNVSSWSDLVSGYSSISLTKQPLGALLNVSDTNILNGDSIKLSANVYAYSGTVEYELEYELDDGTVLTLQDYATSLTFSGKMNFGYSGYLILNVTDSTGAIATDKVYIHVTDSDTYNTSGLVDVGGTLYYLDKGIIDFSYTGLADYNGKTYYVYCGVVYGTTTGFVYLSDGTYYVENSILSTSTGIMEYYGTKYYIIEGKLADSYTGLYKNEDDGLLYYLNSGVMEYYSGLVEYGVDGNTYYVIDGVVSGEYTGLAYTTDGTYYVENSVLSSYTGLKECDGNIYYFVNGMIASDYCGLYESEDDGVTYYVSNGSVTGYANGVAWDDDSMYYVENSIVTDEEVDIIYGWMILQSSSLKKAVMADTVTAIEDSAFYGVTTLKNVVLNDGLESVGYAAFMDCSLTYVIIPESVEYIGEYAFGYYINESYAFAKSDDFTIYGYEGTAAETYAEENGFTFVNVEDVDVEELTKEDDITLGDVDLNGAINYLDAMAVLRYDAELIELDDEQITAGDVNYDGKVNSLDAILILRYDADLIDSF